MLENWQLLLELYHLYVLGIKITVKFLIGYLHFTKCIHGVQFWVPLLNYSGYSQ